MTADEIVMRVAARCVFDLKGVVVDVKSNVRDVDPLVNVDVERWLGSGQDGGADSKAELRIPLSQGGKECV